MVRLGYKYMFLNSSEPSSSFYEAHLLIELYRKNSIAESQIIPQDNSSTILFQDSKTQVGVWPFCGC